MAELLAVGFQETHRAAEVLGQVQGLNAEVGVDLQGAVGVSRTRRGSLRINRSMT